MCVIYDGRRPSGRIHRSPMKGNVGANPPADERGAVIQKWMSDMTVSLFLYSSTSFLHCSPHGRHSCVPPDELRWNRKILAHEGSDGYLADAIITSPKSAGYGPCPAVKCVRGGILMASLPSP